MGQKTDEKINLKLEKPQQKQTKQNLKNKSIKIYQKRNKIKYVDCKNLIKQPLLSGKVFENYEKLTTFRRITDTNKSDVMDRFALKKSNLNDRLLFYVFWLGRYLLMVKIFDTSRIFPLYL